MKTSITFLTALALFCQSLSVFAHNVDYSMVSVGEEAGLDFKKITSDNDYVVKPSVKRFGGKASWDPRKIISVYAGGGKLAYLSQRDNSTNIFIKNLDGLGKTVQRTKRSSVIDFSLSPNEEKIVFSERNGKVTRLFITDSENGYICRQVTDGEYDSSPIFSNDMQHIFFGRLEGKGNSGIWCYSLSDNSLSNIVVGFSPLPLKGTDELVCVRKSRDGKSEIWLINYSTGVEECIVSSTDRSFSSPSISPDGKWILMVGDSALNTGKNLSYKNTDLFVCRIDGTELTQLTYHAADDLSPVWSPDGKFIYFVSKRGSSTGTANVWRIPFILKIKQQIIIKS